MVTILMVVDDRAALTTLKAILPADLRLCSARSDHDIVRLIGTCQPDVVLLEDNDDIESTMRLLHRAIAVPYAPPVIVLSALRTDEVIVDAVHKGAFDYICKPYLAARLRSAVERAVIARAALYARPGAASGDGIGERFLGTSPLAEQVRASIRAYSCIDAPVLLLGESGTGKDLVARLIHDYSNRASGPFEAINCGAVPETLFESEILGSERGAFTDAISRPGLFERTYRGTLFLDEIGETSPYVQVKLLRALESRTIVRVGGSRSTPIDSRIIVATNRDPGQQVASGGFRSDLYYRINVLSLSIPPLRERSEDIPVLAWHWLRELGPDGKSFSPSAVERLVAHSWPGNVRELRNVVQRSALLSAGDRIAAGEIRFL